MSIDSILALLMLLVVVNYWVSRSVLYPPFLFSSMWLMVFFLYRLDLTPMDPLHSETIGIAGLGALLFSFGGGMAMLAPRNIIETRLILTRFPPRNTLIKYLLIVFLACGIPLQIRNIMHQATLGVGNTVFQRARTAGLVAPESAPNPILAYFTLWALYAAPLFLIERRDKSFWAMASVAFMASLLSTGRVPFLMLIGSLLSVQLIMTHRQKFWDALKFARIPILLFFCLYFGLIFVSKDTTVFEGSIATILLLFLVAYIVGPTVAFDYFLRHPQDYASAPHHTFKFFLGIGSALHLVTYVPAPPEDFLLVPFPTNVFTVYRYYIGDFGIYGGLLAIMLIGFVQTLLYRKARTGSELGIYFFSISLFALFMSIFNDEYAAFGSYIDELAFAAIYIVLRSIPLRVLPRLRSGYGVELG
jgi:oligosaccharide repeat unit polymerase